MQLIFKHFILLCGLCGVQIVISPSSTQIIHGKSDVDFVVSNLVQSGHQDPFEVNSWCQALMDNKICDLSGVSSLRNVHEYFAHITFEPGRFSKWVLQKSIQVFREKYGMVKRVHTPFTSIDSLKSEIISDIQDQVFFFFLFFLNQAEISLYFRLMN